MFGERRETKKVEQSWPNRVRGLFARLRCGHAKELRSYRKRVDMDEEDTCESCDTGEVETIEHVVCRCPQLEVRRRRLWGDEFRMEMMAAEPDISRRLLAVRFRALSLEETEHDEIGQQACQL